MQFLLSAAQAEEDNNKDISTDKLRGCPVVVCVCV